MQHALDEAPVLPEDLEGEPPAREVVEYPGVVAGDVHPAAEGGEIDVDGRFLGVAPEHDGVGLHVVLEILALELREPDLYVAASSSSYGGSHGLVKVSGDFDSIRATEGSRERGTGVSNLGFANRVIVF